jgi:hypothetical protein
MEYPMTKIRLNNTYRDIIRQYGEEKIASLIDRKKEQDLYQKLLNGANKAIRAKYPEQDMVVLRKYDQNRFDRCLRFQFPSGRVDGFAFAAEDPETIADTPSDRGCYSSDVFVVDSAFEKAFDEHSKIEKANDVLLQKKQSHFWSLLEFAKTLEDVLAVIDLPQELQERLGKKCTALVALSPDSVNVLKKDFALKAAA